MLEEQEGGDKSTNEVLENLLILSKNKENIRKKRESSKMSLENQAKKMKTSLKRTFLKVT